MKIAILTIHSSYNFGANLQALSTYCYLLNHKFDPIIINYIPRDVEKLYDKTTSINQANAHKKFIHKNMKISNICRNDNEISEVIKNEKIEGLIIGSDAILKFTPELAKYHLSRKTVFAKSKTLKARNFPNPFWLSFSNKLEKKIPIVLMSASCQGAPFYLLFGKKKQEMKKSLFLFDYVSVRDDWTQKMVYNITQKKLKPEITPDPVFAFNDNVNWSEDNDYIKNKFKIKNNYILIGFYNKNVLNQNWFSSLEKIIEKNGYECIELPSPQGGIINVKKRISLPISPKDWYLLIKFSSGYIGEKMHPIIVSLHNNIPFFSFDHYSTTHLKYYINYKSSKIYHILESANLLSNWVSEQKMNLNTITPDYVFKCIEKFDFNKSQKFNVKYFNKYKLLMNNIIDILNK
ncbi:MAG: polysaccharide pyruvyl transferase family protein [Bacteroidales bacterium]|nr:polysaccharide pyruvyl transferase family protein [Bacteroidales bacterium]